MRRSGTDQLALEWSATEAAELDTVYLLMGAVGSTVLILQFAFTLFGFGHHELDSSGLDAGGVDVDHGVDDGHGHGSS